MLALFVELEVDVERKYDRDVHLFAEGSGDGLVGDWSSGTRSTTLGSLFFLGGT